VLAAFGKKFCGDMDTAPLCTRKPKCASKASRANTGRKKRKAICASLCGNGPGPNENKVNVNIEGLRSENEEKNTLKKEKKNLEKKTTNHKKLYEGCSLV